MIRFFFGFSFSVTAADGAAEVLGAAEGGGGAAIDGVLMVGALIDGVLIDGVLIDGVLIDGVFIDGVLMTGVLMVGADGGASGALTGTVSSRFLLSCVL